VTARRRPYNSPNGVVVGKAVATEPHMTGKKKKGSGKKKLMEEGGVGRKKSRMSVRRKAKTKEKQPGSSTPTWVLCKSGTRGQKIGFWSDQKKNRSNLLLKWKE